MFRAVVTSAKLWKGIIAAVSELVDEANFIIAPDGLRLRAMDPSHVAMVELDLPPTAFDEYECDEETVIGVNFDEFNKLLKRAKARERLELELSDRSRLTVKFVGKALRTFRMPLIDIAGEELPSPSLEFNVRAKVIADALRDAIKDASVISDYVKFKADQEVLTILASGDRGDVEVKLSEDMGSLIELDVKEPSASTYSLSYLSDMMKAVAAAEIATIQFSTDMPLRLDFELPGEGRITYYLAPRMEA